RRRHTRFSRDWSSDVCSSDLLNVSAKGNATEIYAAFESCRERLDKQVRRYKRRLRSHHADRKAPVEFSASSSYILAQSEEDEHEIGRASCRESVSGVLVAES